MQSLLWALYQVATGLALLLAGPFLLLRRGRHYLATLPGRFGGWDGDEEERGPAAPAAPLWLHAVSVGEVGVAATLVRALPPHLPLLVTTVTPTGQARARSLLGERARVAYLPFDLGPPLGRFLRRFAPRALVLIEGDLWPLALREARRRGPVVVVNGRVSDRSFARMRRLRPWLGPLLAVVDRFGVQTEEDRTKLLALGVPAVRVEVTGNLKYDSPPPERRRALEAEIARLAAGRPVLLAGSTMAGEEEQVLDAFALMRGGERALLVLAPRHPERFEEVAWLLAGRGVRHVRRTSFGDVGPTSTGPEPPSPPPAVLLLDSLGELAGLYAMAAAAFVGGTLVPTGGHNPLEPAVWGVPTAVGPSMENFRDMAERFDRASAWRRVTDARELATAWAGWLDDPEGPDGARALGARAAALVAENRGALGRTLELLRPVIDRLAAAGPES